MDDLHALYARLAANSGDEYDRAYWAEKAAETEPEADHG